MRTSTAAENKATHAGLRVDTSEENVQEQLLQFLYACPVGLIEVHANGAIGMMNPHAMQLLLPIANTPQMVNVFDVIEAYAPEIRNLVDTYSRKRGTVCDCHRIVVEPARIARGIEAKVLSCTLVKVSEKRFIMTIADVSLQVAQERKLKQAETWFASLLDYVNDFTVISLDHAGRIDGASSSVLRQTGFSKADVLGKTLELFSPQDGPSARLTSQEQMAIASRDGWHLTEGRHHRPTGESYWCQRLIAVQDVFQNERQMSGYTVLLRDVQRQHTDTDKLTRMLREDHLTGAYNRSHFFEIAERECLRAKHFGQPLALIAMDIDHFKQVNDTYGHAVGDDALRQFAQTCMSSLRLTDTFARIGGEEFVALLPSTNLDQAAQLAERFRTSIRKTEISVPDGVLRITASFGCAELMLNEDTHLDLLAAADEALYRGKRLGRDCVVRSHSADLTVEVR